MLLPECVRRSAVLVQDIKKEGTVSSQRVGTAFSCMLVHMLVACSGLLLFCMHLFLGVTSVNSAGMEADDELCARFQSVLTAVTTVRGLGP